MNHEDVSNQLIRLATAGGVLEPFVELFHEGIVYSITHKFNDNNTFSIELMSEGNITDKTRYAITSVSKGTYLIGKGKKPKFNKGVYREKLETTAEMKVISPLRTQSESFSQHTKQVYNQYISMLENKFND